MVNASGEPIIANENTFGGFTSDGQEHASQEMEDGRVHLSPEAMKVLDEQFGSITFPEDVDPSIRTEEEWKMQEALRMLEEAAMQQ